MKGVVKPQAMPTRRNPVTHLQVGGEVSISKGVIVAQILIMEV